MYVARRIQSKKESVKNKQNSEYYEQLKENENDCDGYYNSVTKECEDDSDNCNDGQHYSHSEHKCVDNLEKPRPLTPPARPVQPTQPVQSDYSMPDRQPYSVPHSIEQ